MKVSCVFFILALQALGAFGESSDNGFPWPSLPGFVKKRLCSLCKKQIFGGCSRVCPPPSKTLTVYNLIEPKYTGVANKDAGDFEGDASFIFLTFNPVEAGNPEASIESNVIEMTTVTVEDWSTEYLACNAPGAFYHRGAEKLNCPSTNADYCCSGNSSEVTADTSPAYRTDMLTGGGYWLSFPKESEGKQWTQKLVRRIKGSCLGNEWRKDAGGCPDCGEHLDQCVATCIQKALNVGSLVKNFTQLRPGWDRAFSNKTLCLDQPLPGAPSEILV